MGKNGLAPEIPNYHKYAREAMARNFSPAPSTRQDSAMRSPAPVDIY
jgi:hypothetical protein